MDCRMVRCLVLVSGFLFAVSSPLPGADAAPPGGAKSPLERAARLVELGDGGNAAEVVESLVRENPDNIEARVFLVRYYLTHSRTERTIQSMSIDLPNGRINDGALSMDGKATASPSYADVDVNGEAGRVHVRALSRLGKPGFEALCSLLKDTAPAIRGNAVRGLAQSGDPDRVKVLIEAFGSEAVGSVITEIVRALGRTGSPDAFAVIYKRFAAFPPESRNPAQGTAEEQLLGALYQLPNPAPAAELATQAMKGEPGLRKLAVVGLLKKTDHDGTATVLGLLFGKDEVPDETMNAADSWIRDLGPNHRKMVVQALNSGDQAVVGRALRFAHDMKGDPSMNDALLKLLDSADDQRAQTIIDLLKPPVTEAVAKRFTAMALDLATPGSLADQAAAALSQTTTSLRHIFLGELEKRKDQKDADWQRIYLRTEKAAKGWNDPETARVIVGLVAMDTDPNVARGFARINSNWELGPHEQDLVFGWLTDASPLTPKFEAARDLAYAFAGSSTDGAREAKTRAMKLLDSPDRKRRAVAIQVIMAAGRRVDLTGGERALLSALFEKDLAEFQQSADPQSTSGDNSAGNELQSLASLLGQSIPSRPRRAQPVAGQPSPPSPPPAAPSVESQRSREERIREHQARIQRIIDENRKREERSRTEAKKADPQ